MPSIAELRRDNPWASDYADAELVSMFAEHNKLPLQDAAGMFGYDIPKSNAGKSWSSGVDQYQAGLWDIPAALGSDYARRQAEKNRAEAALVDSTNDAVKSFEDVHSLSDFGSFVKHGAIQSAPYLMEAVGAGLTGGGTAVARGIGQAGLRTLGRGAVEREAAELLARNAGMGAAEAERLAAENVAKGYARSAAAGIGSYPSSVGAVLGRQVEETGQYDPATAFALGVPYAALNTVGLEGQMLRGMPRGLSASALRRGAVGFAEGALPEAGSEMAQTFLERTGAGLDPFGPGSAREYIDSGVLGSVLGGAPGSVSAGVRGPAIRRDQVADLLDQGVVNDRRFMQDYDYRLAEDTDNFRRDTNMQRADAISDAGFSQRRYGDQSLDLLNTINSQVDQRIVNRMDRPNNWEYSQWWQNVPDPANPEAYQRFWQGVAPTTESAAEDYQLAQATAPFDRTQQPGYAPVQIANDASVGNPAAHIVGPNRYATSTVPAGGFGVSGTLARLDAASMQQLVPFLQNGGEPAFQQLAGQALASGRADIAQKVAAAWQVAKQYQNQRIQTVQGKPVAAQPQQVAPKAGQAPGKKAQPKPAAAPATQGVKPKTVHELAREIQSQVDGALGDGLIDREVHAELTDKLATTPGAHTAVATALGKAVAAKKNENRVFDNEPEFVDHALSTKTLSTNGFKGKESDLAKADREAFLRYYGIGEFAGAPVTSYDSLAALYPERTTGKGKGAKPSHESVRSRLKQLKAHVDSLRPTLLSVQNVENEVSELIPGEAVAPEQTAMNRVLESDSAVEAEDKARDAADKTGDKNAAVGAAVSSRAKDAWNTYQNEKYKTEAVDYFTALPKEIQVSLSDAYVTAHESKVISTESEDGTVKHRDELTTKAKQQEILTQFSEELEDPQRAVAERAPAEKGKGRTKVKLDERDDTGVKVLKAEGVAKQLERGAPGSKEELKALMEGNHGTKITQFLRTQYALPKAVYKVDDVLNAIEAIYKDEQARLEALVADAAKLWGSTTEFANLPAQAQIDFAQAASGVGDMIYTPGILNGIKGDILNEYGITQTAESAAGVPGGNQESVPGDSSGVVGDGTSGQNQSGVRIERKKTRRIAKPDEAAGRGNSEAQAGEVGAPLHRRESLTFTDSTGDKITEEVEWLDEAQYPDVTDALDAVEDGPLAGTLDKVDGFFISHNGDAYAYKNPDGTFKIVLPHNVLAGNPELLSEIIHHELAHVADAADGAAGGVNSYGAVMSVMVQKAKALYDRLPDTSKLRKLLDYPFNAKYPESKSAKLMRTELYAQLVAARLNPALAAELKAASPALYNFAETIVNEIEEQYQAKADGTVSGVGATASVYSGSSPVFRRDAGTAAQRVQALAGESGVQMMDDAGGVVSRAFKWFMSLHDLVGEYGHVLPSAQKWYDSVRAAIATRKQLESDAEAIAARAGKLKPAVLKQLNEFISRSTFEQKWGYDAEFEKLDGGKRQVKADVDMAKLFNALPKDAQEIAKDVFSHGEKMKLEKFRIMKELGLTGVLNQTGSLQGPYAPLKRFGDYVAVLKSKELRAAEAAEDEKLVAELKADPDHYVVSNFDTLGQARKFARANEAQFGWSDAFKGSVRVEDGRPMKPETLQKVLAAIKAAIKADELPASVKGQVESLVRDMYLQAFDEHNARMSGLKRKNRAGYDEDMIRSFLSHARAEAGFLANMKHGGTTNEMFYKMQQEAKGEAGKRTGQDVFDAIARHYAANLEHKETPWQDRALALTSIQQLALNPAYHLQNSLQPIMVTVPRLAADFNNYSGAWNALRQGYAITREIVSGGFFTDTKIDLSKVKNDKLRAMLQSAADAGLLDVGLEEDLNKFEATRTGYAALDKTSAVGKKVVHKLRQVSRRVEAYNRVSAAVAAYNMHYAKGGNTEAATAYAISVLQDTQGDFSKADAPLIIKKLPKFVVQYRKFQLMMAAHYVKAARDAFAGETPEVKAIGRRALLISLGHAFAGAGFLGLPLMNLVGLAFSKVGDDDEPRDLERVLREQLGEGDLTNFLLHGPLWFMGMDAKLSQDKIFSILPYADWDLTSKKGVMNLGAGLAGPSGSAAMKFAEGLGSIGKGDYYKGLAQVLPSGFGNAVHAFEVANKGYTLKNGDVMVKPEDVETFQLLLDGLGLKSPEMRRMDWYKNQQWETKQFFSDRTKEIEHQYSEAYKEGDANTMSDLREQWLALQDGKDRLRYLFNDSHDELKRQPLSNLLKYPRTVAKREAKLQRTVGN